jgi:ApeA N-terminal domain 1
MRELDAKQSNRLVESCKELLSGWSGRLYLENGSITAHLHCFDDKTNNRSRTDRSSLILETGKIATLLGCSRLTSGTRMTATTRILIEKFNASYLLLGTREWQESDKVSIFEFCIPEAKGSLFYGEHHEVDVQQDSSTFVNVQRVYDSRMEIMRLRGDGFEVVISKKPSLLVLTFEDLGDDPTWISIHYDEARPLLLALEVPYQIQTFFELSEGKPLREMALTVRSDGSGGMEARTTAGLTDTRLQDFALHRSWRADDYQESKSPGAEQIFRVFNSSERDKTKTALGLWLSRREKWKITYWLASQFARGGTVYHRSKLLQAMAWFESIPDYQLDVGLNDKALQEFRRASRELDSFKTLNVPVTRYSEVLNELKRLPVAERFQAAISDIRATFGENLLGDTLQSDCEKAIKLRNYAAHGSHSDIEDDFREFIIATSAVETVALLTTIRLLGADPDHIGVVANRFAPHPYASYQSWVDTRPKPGG